MPLPQVKLRKMRSQWGNCHYQQGYITLNTALARCPEPLRDYVALHELVHFLHHDHGTGFYAAMDARSRLAARRQERRDTPRQSWNNGNMRNTPLCDGAERGVQFLDFIEKQ